MSKKSDRIASAVAASEADDVQARVRAMTAELAAMKAALKAAQEAAKAQNRTGSGLTLKVSEKGGLSVYGLGKFPVTLYKGQWGRLLSDVQSILSFIEENDHLLTEKAK